MATRKRNHKHPKERSEAKAQRTQPSGEWREICNRTFHVFASQGFWANLIIGIVLLLVGPAFGLIMKNPKIAIIAAGSGLTILLWLIAIIAIRQIDIQANVAFKLSTITEFQSTRLIALLSRFAGQKVILIASSGQQASTRANDLQHIFHAARWIQERPILQAPARELSMDLQVSSSNLAPAPPSNAVARDLVNYFKFVGMKCRTTVILDPDVAQDEIVVWVGPQSPEGVSPDNYPPQATHLPNLKPFSE